MEFRYNQGRAITFFALTAEKRRSKRVRLEDFNGGKLFIDFLDAFRLQLSSIDQNQLNSVVQSVGSNLWELACAQVDRGFLDDRPLYWARLKAQSLLEAELSTRDDLSKQEVTDLLNEFEWYSRGLSDFDSAQSHSHTSPIICTGFDPFHLNSRLDQSNPSGLVALHLAKRKIAGQSIRTAIYPVRFHAFDSGLVEASLTSVVQQAPLFMLTVSMGRTQFDLERFTSSRRSTEALDNEDVLCAGSPSAPVRAVAKGPEFLEFNLPVDKLCSVQSDWSINDNRTVSTLENGTFEALNLDEINEQTAIAGSGGGFLSNEIAHRVLLMKRASNREFPTGHVHVPKVAGYQQESERAITQTVEQMLRAGMQASTASTSAS